MISVHMMKVYARVEVQLCSSLTSALDEISGQLHALAVPHTHQKQPSEPPEQVKWTS